ncbi:MAG: TIGR01777 family oxidoreductase [Actinomycetota bacterium]
MKVLLAGGSGLIGTALSESLIGDGHMVRKLVRRAPSQPSEVEWHPERGELDPSVLDGIDAAVCLSGAGVGDKRWTNSYKQALRASRIGTSKTLADALASAHNGPRTFLAGSAVGYYGDAGDRIVDESTPAGDSFLARLCVDWEAASAPAQQAGVRVVNLRTGLLLSANGGLLTRLKPIVWLGLGGRLGSGRQYCPWISMRDEIAAIRFLLDSPDVSGPVNLTGPEPVRNAEFIATVARLIHRPAIVPAPGFALRAVLGEFAEDILTGQRAVPAKLAGAGFEFADQTLEAALRDALT